jgi:hypothetical protein
MSTATTKQTVCTAGATVATPAEAPREISLSRPSPADSTEIDRGEELEPSGSHKPAEKGAIPLPAPNTPDPSIPDEQLTRPGDMRRRMDQLVARMVVLSERIAAMGITREETVKP